MGILFRPQVILIAAIAAVAALGGSPALAQSEGTVTATVTPQVISISVSPSTVDYGVVTLGSSDNVPSPASVTATNNGSVAEDFGIKGANTTPGNWALVTTAPGANEYRHRASKDSFATNQPLTTASVPFTTNTAASASETVSLKLDAPSSSTSVVQQSAAVTLLATAAP